MAGTTATTTHPTPDKGPEQRFTFGLVLDVAKVIEAHGYGRFDGPQFVELQQHLFHLLHGNPGDPGDRCTGRTIAVAQEVGR